MTEEECVFLNNMSPYFKMLEEINKDLLEIKKNIFLKHEDPYFISEKIFLISTNILRLLPYKINEKRKNLLDKKIYNYRFIIQKYNPKVNNKIKLEEKSGILLLKKNIKFISEDYIKIINENFDVLSQLIIIRNKYIHEPHNIRWCKSLGNEKDYKIDFKYKKFNQYDFSKKFTYTITEKDLKKLVIDLNNVFIKIHNLSLKIIDNASDFIRNYPYAIYLKEINFNIYNKILNGEKND